MLILVVMQTHERWVNYMQQDKSVENQLFWNEKARLKSVKSISRPIGAAFM